MTVAIVGAPLRRMGVAVLQDGSLATWTDDRIATLKRLWTDGLSCSQIAKQLGGITRSAVIGKVHRLNLSGRVVASRRGGYIPKPRPFPILHPPKKARVVASPTSPMPVPIEELEPVRQADGKFLTVLTIRRGVCNWICNDPHEPGGAVFCGRPATGSFCAGHKSRAFIAIDRRKDKHLKDSAIRLAR